MQLAGRSHAVARALAHRDLRQAAGQGLEPKWIQLLEFAEYCVKYPWRISDDMLEALRQTGFSDEEIAEAGLNVGFFLMLTTMADLYRIGENEPLYMDDDLSAWEEAGAPHQPAIPVPYRARGSGNGPTP